MKHSPLLIAIGIAVSSLLVTGCDKKEEEANAAAAQQQTPPAVVNVMPVKFQTVPLVKEFSGRTAAYEVADIRPQVTGVVDEILYPQGQMVKKGQPLYRLSLENYTSSQNANQAAVQQAQANVQTAKASYNNAVANIESQRAIMEQAQADVTRLKPLVAQQAISEQQYEQAVTELRTAQAGLNAARAAAQQAQANIASSEAAVATAKAQLSSSQLDISRTIVRSPISGISERSNVTAGALVNANQANPLVTISKINPIYVDISQSSSELLQLKQQQASGSLQSGSSSVELVLEDGSTYPVRGQLSLAEAKVDEDTGSVTLRAIFKNDNYMLLPGMYVQARIIQGLINNAVLLPQSAVTRTPKGATQVYIVDKNNKIQLRDVTVKGTYEGNWIVTDGLKAGENIVVVGGSKVKPDQEVVAKPYQPEPEDTNKAPQAANEAQPQGPVAQKSGIPKGPVAPEKKETSNTEATN